jgi:hypothetical protein
LQLKTIDHDPDEKRPTNRIWWIVSIIIALNAVDYLYFRTPDWWGMGLGFIAGTVLATWAIEVTGNKVPDLLRGKSRRS